MGIGDYETEVSNYQIQLQLQPSSLKEESILIFREKKGKTINVETGDPNPFPRLAPVRVFNPFSKFSQLETKYNNKIERR